MGYRADTSPGSFMYIMPTIETMERNVKARIDPMIQDTPSLLTKFGQKRSRDGGNTLKQKDGLGVVWFLSGANSAASLASIAVRDILFDEPDRYPADVDGEGDPISLAEGRQNTYGTRKRKVKISSPTHKKGRIYLSYQNTDQQHYFVPCPHCKETQDLKWSQFRWTPGVYSVETVHYECEHCKEAIYERDKTWMFEPANGAHWKATKPENSCPEIKGCWLPSFYSPDGWLAWWEICKAWDESEGDEPKRKAVINTMLGEPYEEESEVPEWEQLFERAKVSPYKKNKPGGDVAFIVAGVDVQGDRIEVEIVGWSKGRISQQIDYRVQYGDPAEEDVWNWLADILDETWEREDGGVLGVRVMTIDTGYKGDRVDDFAKKYPGRVYPIKGSDSLGMPFSAPKALRKTKQGKNIGKLKVWHIGVSYLKSQLYGWLRLRPDLETGEIPNGYCWFTEQDTKYFRGITAEVYQLTRNKKGHIVYQWIKKYERNEPLDLRVYAMAAAYIVGFDRWNDARWDREHGSVEVKAEKTAVAKPAKKKRDDGNDFWNRNR